MAGSVLITGANRGLGLEFVRQYLERDWKVIACARSPEEPGDLSKIQEEAGEHLLLVELDVASQASVDAAAKKLKGEPIDILLHNAGIMGAKGALETTGPAEILRVFDTNVLGPYRVTRALLPNVEAGEVRKIIFITSQMGSIGDGPSGGYYPYRISKSALNMLGANLAEELRDRSILTALLHPGWVRTRMGGESATVTPAESVKGMRRVIDGLHEDDSGGFFHAEGHAVPW